MSRGNPWLVFGAGLVVATGVTLLGMGYVGGAGFAGAAGLVLFGLAVVG